MKQSLAALIRFSGLPFLVRETICRKRATIVVYHDPAPEVFEAHLAYLVEHFAIISLDQLVEAIEQHDWERVPPKSLCITFDDGHRRNFALLDLVKRYNVPITAYVCSGIVDTTRHYWFLDFADRAEGFKSLPNQVRLQRLAAENGYKPEEDFAERQALSKADMLEMKLHGVDFQSHTLFHPILVACSDEECWLEVSDSKKVLENLLGNPVEHFAYPNGDYGEREIAYMQKAGYRSARTVDAGWNGPDTNLYALKSMVVSDNSSLEQMIAQLHGINLRYLRQRSSAGKRSPTSEVSEDAT
jgi:peptidoglycan/xylan/chitin deacetylase (PgdA/CDA1 family)